jgi:hypothetical protein
MWTPESVYTGPLISPIFSANLCSMTRPITASRQLGWAGLGAKEQEARPGMPGTVNHIRCILEGLCGEGEEGGARVRAVSHEES